jgi:hypothetical protein
MKRKIGILFLFLIFSATSPIDARGIENEYFLLPQPQKITYKGTILDLKPGRFIWLNTPIDDDALYTA